MFANRLSHQAAALAYYTVFTIVPILVVALWALKAFHVHPLSHAREARPRRMAEATSEVRFPNANVLLREAVRGILVAVERAGRLETGIVGLAALAVRRDQSVIHVESALDTIAGARDRPPRYRRMLGYLALLALPPALFVVRACCACFAHLPVGTTLARWTPWLLATCRSSSRRWASSSGWGLLCVALAIFYASAARARIASVGASFGGALGAVMLAGVLWAFTRLQIGVSRAGALESGMAADAGFLLWSFSSWLVILIGAQIAVAHELDGVLIHGARTLQLDPYGEQMAAAWRSWSRPRGALSSDDAARRRRRRRHGQRARPPAALAPGTSASVAGRLRAAGILRQADAGGLSAGVRSRSDELARRRRRGHRPPGRGAAGRAHGTKPARAGGAARAARRRE